MRTKASVRRAPALAGLALPALLLGACSSTPPAEPVVADHAASALSTPATSYPKAEPPGPLYSLFHRPLKVPDGLVEVMRLHGEGAEIFRCEAQANGPHWAYRLPDAELRDAAGAVAVHHGANLSFEHVDGSRLLGEIADHVASPTDNALPWLLMTTRSYGTGALAGVRYVERVDTAGGMPPPACDVAQLNQVLRVPFSADFVFLR